MSGRIRTVKPEWLEDSKVARLGDSDRLLSIALLLVADDHGRGRAEPEFIASRAWTYDPREGAAKAREGLARLSEAGFVTLYEVDGQRYFEIRNWKKHQRVDKPSAPRVPGPDQADSRTCESFATSSRESREDVAKVPEGLAPDPDLRTPYPVPPSVSPARAHARLPDGHLTADAIAAELAAHHRLAQLATDPDFPSTLLSRAMGKGTKAEWLVDAIADAAADTPAGEQAHATMKRVRAYCDRARPPRRDGDEARPLATDPPAPPKLPAGTGRLPPPMPLPERVVQPRFHGAATSPGQSAPNPAPDDHADAGNPSTPGRALRVPPTAISDLLANMPRPSGEP